MKNFKLQAELFTIYLVGHTATPAVIKLYERAIKSTNQLNKHDQKLLEFIIKHPSCIGMIDAGLVFYNPYSEIRRRLYVTFAILEANPDYYESFLPKDRNLFYPIFVFYSCFRAMLKALFGFLLVRIVV